MVLLTRMFDAYQQSATPSRIDTYLDVIGDLPVRVIEEAIREAMRTADGFPPGPGTIRRQALAIAGMRPGDPVEMPRDVGPRIGPGAAPAGSLLSGIEARVERNYARVIARSREIRSERKLPDSLDARLYSLGVAESELHYADSPYACRCAPRCDMGALDRSLAEQRENAEARLRRAGYLAA